MAIRVLLAMSVIFSAVVIAGCGDGSVPADPSVSKIGKDDGSDAKISKRLGTKGQVPQATAGGQ